MITLAEPIVLGGIELIAAGAAGRGKITEVEKAGAPGKPGKIVVEFSELGTRGGFKTADGASIKLKGTGEKIGKGKKTLAFVTIVGIFLIKGGQGEITADDIFIAHTAETIVLTGE